MATADNTPKDVDREYVMAFMITDEHNSFMLRQNLARAFPSLPTLQYSSLVGSYPSFADSESFHHINGELLGPDNWINHPESGVQSQDVAFCELPIIACLTRNSVKRATLDHE